MSSRNIAIIFGAVVLLCLIGYALGWFGGVTTPPVAPVTAPAQ